MGARAEQAPLALKGSCYVTPEVAGRIKPVEDLIEGLTIEMDSLPEGMVSVNLYGEERVVWPSVWEAIRKQLDKERT